MQGMGALDKLILVWDAPWWPRASDFVTREMASLGGRWAVFLNYWPLFRVPVLVALNAADDARELAGMSDAEVVEDAMKVRDGGRGG